MNKPLPIKGLELLGGMIVLAIYTMDMLEFFPNKGGMLGHDWQYFVPSMLDGYYSAMADGFFKIHWFTPALCGGVPKFPNPQDQYFSIPQLLFFWGGPLYSLRVTVFLMATAGFVGSYLLLNRSFGLSKPAALTGGTVFLFNGFFAAGMIVGHMTKHSFMLLPFDCFFIMTAATAMREDRPLLKCAPWVSAAALSFAYTLYSGGFIIFPQMLLTALGAGFLAALFVNDFKLSRFLTALAASAIFSTALAANKIEAVSSFLHVFPRDYYPMPLIPKLVDIGRLFVNSLFGDAALLNSSLMFVSIHWELGLHELDFGITWVPAVLTVTGLVVWLVRGANFRLKGLGGFGAIIGLALVLLAPLALNFYAPWWQAVLKATPVIKHSTSNVRWLAIYIPLFSIIAAICLDYVFKRERPAMFAGLLLSGIVAATTMFPNRAEYKDQPYDPKQVTEAYNAAKQEGRKPDVLYIAAIVSDGVPFASVGRNDLLVRGWSSYMCYEPVFGYNLEKFPYQTLHLGLVTEMQNGRINLKNPSCMIFPAENGCQPGDHFRAEENDKIAKFISYRNFDFKLSTKQRAANGISAVAWFYLAAIVAATLLSRGGSRTTRMENAPSPNDAGDSDKPNPSQ